MAQINSPNLDFGGAGPQSQGVLVTEVAVGGLAVFGPHAQILTSPSASQLVPAAPIPDAGLFVWQRSIVDAAGNTLNDARVDVRHAETNAVAEIYEDREATTRRSNPFLVDSEGFARFYAPAGLYKITASRSGLERIFENVLIGIRLEDFPDLTPIVGPIIDGILEPIIDDLDAQVAALPELIGFRVLAAGTGQGMPAGYESQRLGVGSYRVTHNEGTLNYNAKLTVWDPSSDRVYAATMSDQQLNHFDYRVRSIHDEATASDADVDVELTF